MGLYGGIYFLDPPRGLGTQLNSSCCKIASTNMCVLTSKRRIRSLNFEPLPTDPIPMVANDLEGLDTPASLSLPGYPAKRTWKHILPLVKVQ